MRAMGTNSELKEVTGMKGMAALIVMLSHYSIAFFPAVWNAEYQFEHVQNVERIIHRTPLYFFMNGSLMVNVFWCISGFLIGYAWYQNKSTQLLKRRILGRYFKLVIPITLSEILAYIFQVNKLFYNHMVVQYTYSEWLAGFYQFEPSLFTSITDGIYGVFFEGSSRYNPILWTIKAEMLGICMSAFFLAIWGNEDTKRRNRVYMFLAVIVNSFYPPLFAFLVGIFISDKYLQGITLTKKNSVLCVGIALVLGSFMPIWRFIPAEIIISNNWSINTGEIFRTISAGLLLICILNVATMGRILRSRVFLFLGNVSMYLYIFHFMILCSFTCWIFIRIHIYATRGYLFSALVSSLCGILITVFLSFLLKKTIDNFSKKLLNRICILL